MTDADGSGGDEDFDDETMLYRSWPYPTLDACPRCKSRSLLYWPLDRDIAQMQCTCCDKRVSLARRVKTDLPDLPDVV